MWQRRLFFYLIPHPGLTITVTLMKARAHYDQVIVKAARPEMTDDAFQTFFMSTFEASRDQVSLSSSSMSKPAFFYVGDYVCVDTEQYDKEWKRARDEALKNTIVEVFISKSVAETDPETVKSFERASAKKTAGQAPNTITSSTLGAHYV